MKKLALIAVIVTGAFLIRAMNDVPAWGDADSPANSGRLSQYYITESYKDTHVPNLVTSLLADYRSYDTLFETAVVFTALIAILAIVRIHPKEDLDRQEDLKVMGSNLIIRNTTRMLLPVIQLFALYVIAHGHISPGGGFQGGVIFGASMILLAVAFDLKTAMKRLSERRAMIVSNLGVLIYSGIGLICMICGAQFLNYSSLDKILHTGPVMARYHSMLGIEIGVGFTVAAVMFLIYANLSSRGDLEEGL